MVAATFALESVIVRHDPAISAKIALAEFNAAPAELRVRLIAALIDRYGGSHASPQLVEIERLVERLTTATQGATLGGCILRPRRGVIEISREPGVKGLPSLVLQPAETATWDNRFTVSLGQAAPGPCLVRALDADMWRLLRATGRFEPLCAKLAVTLPSFWNNDQLVCVPSIVQRQSRQRHTPCTAPTELFAFFAAQCHVQPNLDPVLESS